MRRRMSVENRKWIAASLHLAAATYLITNISPLYCHHIITILSSYRPYVHMGGASLYPIQPAAAAARGGWVWKTGSGLRLLCSQQQPLTSLQSCHHIVIISSMTPLQNRSMMMIACKEVCKRGSVIQQTSQVTWHRYIAVPQRRSHRLDAPITGSSSMSMSSST